MPRTLTFLLLTVGCAPFAQQEDYYETWAPPTISELSSTSEAGNLGGGTLTITGSGFGDDKDQILVQFGDESAEILSVSDTELEVRVPGGPITGGAVDIRIATKTGTETGALAYTYDVGDQFDAQVGHVQVNDFWESCRGGMSDRLDTEWSDTLGYLGCQEIASFGLTGIDGIGEALSFRYPRLHTQNIGWSGGTDQGSSDWVIERPSQGGYAYAVEDLHVDIGEVVLRNEVWEGDAWCPTLDDLAVYRYGGGIDGFLDPVNVVTEDVLGGEECDPGDEGAYDLDELHFCSSPTEDGVPSYIYRADWPSKENFFRGKKRDWTKPGDILISAPEVGIVDTPVTVPEALIVTATEGFDELEAGVPIGDLWSLTELQGCFDEAGDTETLDDVAFRFTWERSEVSEDDGDQDCLQAGEVCSQYTYVRLTFTSLDINWFGGSSYPVRATVVVDDRHEPDGTTSSLEVPASVLYQFPTIQFPSASPFGDGLLDSTQGDWGILIVTFERVTDYSVLTDAGDTVVFSYTTGDFGYYGWDNPIDADECHDCADGDSDGWADADDPDCAAGTEESGFGDTACNDGRDNDGDGFEDAEDLECDNGEDGDESDCDNLVDDDEDGITDELDPGCIDGGNEVDDPPTACADELDNDADGWSDADDPDCASGAEELGYGTTACNDGVDNDGNGDVDGADPECTDASMADEGSATVSGCADGLDGDADGWTDADDPDCATGTEELGYGGTACNDGVDNDGNGDTDAADPDCLAAVIDDESTVVVVTDCTDALDGDGDGWTDSADPDCSTGSAELGFGTTQCNNGTDDDADGNTDAVDLECADADDDDEAL